MRRYTKEQLIFFLKRLAAELKHTPTQKDNDANKNPCSSTYVSRFGSWNSALTSAGLRLNLKREYTKSELKESLVHLAKELGRAPREKDLEGKVWVASSSTYRKYFGSFKEALKESGLTKNSNAVLRHFVKKK